MAVIVLIELLGVAAAAAVVDSPAMAAMVDKLPALLVIMAVAAVDCGVTEVRVVAVLVTV